MLLEAFATNWNTPFEYSASSYVRGMIASCPSSIILEQEFWQSYG